MFYAGIATWAVLAQPCVYCFILPRASEHHFLPKAASLLHLATDPLLFQPAIRYPLPRPSVVGVNSMSNYLYF